MARELLMFAFRRSSTLGIVRPALRAFVYPGKNRVCLARVALVALLVAPLCACPQQAGHASDKAGPAASASAATPAGSSTAAKVMVSTLAAVPGHKIAATQGFGCRFFLWDGTGNYADKFQGALQAFRSQAAKQGADAIVNLKVSAIPFAKQESKGTGSVVNLCGDEVKFQ